MCIYRCDIILIFIQGGQDSRSAQEQTISSIVGVSKAKEIFRDDCWERERETNGSREYEQMKKRESMKHREGLTEEVNSRIGIGRRDEGRDFHGQMLHRKNWLANFLPC